MKKTFKCEFCGRHIKTEQCPYCGGVNDIPLTPGSDAPSGKAADCYPPYPPRKKARNNNSFFGKLRTFFSEHTCLRDIVLAVLFIDRRQPCMPEGDFPFQSFVHKKSLPDATTPIDGDKFRITAIIEI